MPRPAAIAISPPRAVATAPGCPADGDRPGPICSVGYPQAHEDDAERAVRAGLELIEAVAALKARDPLQTRVGIATGLVVVGDLIGSGAAQEHGSRRRDAESGGPPARRWPSRTRSSSPTSTRRLLGDLSSSTTSGPEDLKGFAGAGAGLAGAAAERGGEPVRGAAHRHDAAGRPRRGDRAADAALGAGESGRRLASC